MSAVDTQHHYGTGGEDRIERIRRLAGPISGLSAVAVILLGAGVQFANLSPTLFIGGGLLALIAIIAAAAYS